MVRLGLWKGPLKRKGFELSFEIREDGQTTQTGMAGSEFQTDGAMKFRVHMFLCTLFFEYFYLSTFLYCCFFCGEMFTCASRKQSKDEITEQCGKVAGVCVVLHSGRVSTISKFRSCFKNECIYPLENVFRNACSC